jgi:hypothetical protein
MIRPIRVDHTNFFKWLLKLIDSSSLSVSLSLSLALSFSQYILYSSHMNFYHMTSADHLTTVMHERQGIGMVMLEVMALSLPPIHPKASLKASLVAASLEVSIRRY